MVVNVIVYYACVDLCVVYADNESETKCRVVVNVIVYYACVVYADNESETVSVKW